MEISKYQRTKLLVTVGPACRDYSVMLEMVQSGVDAFRLNFSHGSHEDHLKAYENVQYINKKYGTNISVLADLQGPKLRIGEMENGGIPIEPGDILTFVNEKCVGNKERIYMSYELFPQDVEVGEKVLVDDGKIELEVVETNRKDTVKLRVLHGEILSSKKGVNLPETNVSQPALTDKDIEDLNFILEHNFNWIALSFVRHPKDIEDLRTRIQAKSHRAKIMAKIEKPEAIKYIDDIISATDGVMVARGDLGVEVPMEMLPTLQKMIIRKCIEKAKPVVVATQLMDSMITNPSPTRAEIIDVANAVVDGTDAVMLSAETSVGKHPVRVVQAMCKIVAQAETEASIYYKNLIPNPASRTYLSDAICYNACKIAREVNARVIIGMTKSGYTGFMVSSYRPQCDIFIFSDDDMILKALNLVWGIRGYHYDKFSSTDESIRDVQEILKDNNFVRTGDVVVNIGTMPLYARKRTNMVKVTVVE